MYIQMYISIAHEIKWTSYVSILLAVQELYIAGQSSGF